MASSDILLEHITGEFSEIAVCSICTEEFTNPRLLDCRHTFCLHCLQRCTEGKRWGESVACPVCRRESVIPRGGMVNLERNRDMEKLVEASQRVESRLKEGLYYCDKHSGKPIMLYCVTCSCMLCSTCIVSSHVGHQYQETADAADELVKQVEAKLGDNVTECLAKLQRKVMQIDRVKRVCQKTAVESRAKILDRYKELEALIRSDRDNVLSELGLVTDELQKLKDQTNSFVGKLRSFGDIKEGKKRPLDVISLCSDLLQLPVEDILCKTVDETSLSFEPNVKLLKLESKAVNLVGTVNYVPLMRQAQKQKGFTAGYSENVPKSIFGASAVTDEHFEDGKVQPVCPDWCCCEYCEPMTDVSERRCCASIRKVLHVCESAGVACVTQLQAFNVNCLNLSVIQLDFYEEYERPQQQLPKPIHEIYRELSYVRFRRWIYRVLRGHVTNGVPACALDRIRQTFAPEEMCSYDYPR